jgi:hypothetical protein
MHAGTDIFTRDETASDRDRIQTERYGDGVRDRDNRPAD